MRKALLFFGLSLATLAGCTATPSTGDDAAANEDELRTTYGQLFDTLEGSDLDRWYDVQDELKKGFDRICGDTICSGDYSNLTTVRITCSSTQATKKMKDCLWVLGGNIDFVDGRTGKLTSDVKTWACHIPVGSNAKQFLDVLSAAGDKALDTTLPGTTGTFYDGLTKCFEGVVGPLPPSATQTFYSELGEYLWENGGGEGWDDTRRKLNEGFDQVCGDTFCEGDFSDIVGLRFACSVNANTKRVSRCGWSFSGADVSVDSRGALSARTFAKRCDFAVGATATQLTSALSGNDPLNATLPNSTKTIYDGLVGCL